jgi:hypothetical protein
MSGTLQGFGGEFLLRWHRAEVGSRLTCRPPIPRHGSRVALGLHNGESIAGGAFTMVGANVVDDRLGRQSGGLPA